jgi:hypothetical protein
VLISLLVALSLSSGRATRLTDVPTPSGGSSDSSILDPGSKWSFAFPQFVAGVGGAALGGFGGALTGGMFGFFVWAGDGQKYEPDCNTVCTPDAGTQIETGARIGALLGVALGATRVVIGSSPKRFPSNNPLGTFAGAIVGGGLGWVATQSMRESDGGYTWPRWGALAVSSSLGAVLTDRWFADSLAVSVDVAIWTPSPRARGLMLRMGI